MANNLMAGLPGADLICQGLLDVENGKESVPALLIAIGYPRLKRLGLISTSPVQHAIDPEIRLFRLLKKEKVPDPYSQYNSLIRRLVSFEQASEFRYWRSKRLGQG